MDYWIGFVSVFERSSPSASLCLQRKHILIAFSVKQGMESNNQMMIC
jgi:hypothetical protein